MGFQNQIEKTAGKFCWKETYFKGLGYGTLLKRKLKMEKASLEKAVAWDHKSTVTNAGGTPDTTTVGIYI